MKINKAQLLALNQAAWALTTFQENIAALQELDEKIKHPDASLQVSFSFNLVSKTTGEAYDNYEFTIDSSDNKEDPGFTVILGELMIMFGLAASRASIAASELGLDLNDDNV